MLLIRVRGSWLVARYAIPPRIRVLSVKGHRGRNVHDTFSATYLLLSKIVPPLSSDLGFTVVKKKIPHLVQDVCPLSTFLHKSYLAAPLPGGALNAASGP